MERYAIKLQVIAGDSAGSHGYDYRGSEPNDQHRTIAEIDPCNEPLELIQPMVIQANELLKKLNAKAGELASVEIRIMDSDGR